MKFVNARQLRNNIAQVRRDLAREQAVILTGNGKPFALMVKVPEDGVEEYLGAVRRALAVAAIEQIQMHSVRAGLDKMTLKEINAEIEVARKSMR